MKKNIKTLAALLIASATFVACSSDNDIISENQQPANGKYTMTIQASKGDGATTRALNLTDHTLNATWSEGEIVEVYQGGSKIGELTAAASTDASTTLTGTFDDAPSTSADLTFYFHTNTTSYSGQDGTLATIASSYDFCAPATVATGDFTVNSANHTISVPAGISFGANQQAIVKFTLLDKGNSDAAISATQLVVNDGTNAYIVTPASGTSEIYVAIPGISEQTVTLIATVGDDTYTYEKSGVTFTNGQYYEITVKMTQAPALNLTSPAVGQVIGDDGKNYAAGSLPGGVTAVAKICYVSGSTGLALALADEGQMIWSTAISTCAAHTPAFTNGTWKLATQDEWNNMITAAGGYTALRDGFSSVGGSNLQSAVYWSSTEKETWYAWSYNFVNGNWGSDGDHKYFDGVSVRACLAWTQAAAAPAFQINAGGTQVRFAQGNLRYVSGAWSFFDHQYDYYATYSADAWDKFGWSNSTNNFGMSTSTNNADYQGDLVDWGTVPGIGTGWFTLSNDEWGYLFNTRNASTVNSVDDARYAKGKVNGVYGIILFPDTYTHPTGVTLPVGINEDGNTGWNGNNYSVADWTAMETAGCVFLPATGYRQGTSVQDAGSCCSYRSSTRDTSNTDWVYYVYFTEGRLNVSCFNSYFYGQCVRLVCYAN